MTTPSNFKKGGIKKWVLFVVILILIALGIVYYLAPSVLAPGTMDTVRQLEMQGSSDEIPSIEEDLNATDLSELDAELSDIESELQGI